MTKKLLSDRIDGAIDYISSGPTDINTFEQDVADLVGFAIDTLYEDSPFSFDSDGNLTSSRAGDSAQTIFKGAETAVGFRLWDSTNSKEVLISMEDDQFIIYENTGTLGESGTWQERFNIDLPGTVGDDAGQDILNHTRMPSSLDDGKYLRADVGNDTIEWASVDVGDRDSAGASHVAGHSISSDSSYHDYDETWTDDWDNNGSIYVNAAIDYFEIQESGIYLIQLNMAWDSDSGGSRVVGYHTTTGNGITRLARTGGHADAGDAKQIMSPCWVESLSAGTKLYPKASQNSGGALTVVMNRFAITKISEA